ncbi:putative Anaphase-promoting complex subunit 1 [Gigaspora margarita]|uniref:Putative Anaphase-promoting complex subunit 1 n=1 Tax=Gigaspora margarita TaxID=4874 RepID=A0A8H4ANH9_GIGMA|nr:putative Anaphase-promoting complex subunit 1 [Gigaspora margarita]
MEVRVLAKFIPFGEQYRGHEIDSTIDRSKFSYKLYGGFNQTTNELTNPEDIDEELFIANNEVIWSRGNVLIKSFKFEEPVVQALFVWFNVTKARRNSYCDQTDLKTRNTSGIERQRALFVVLENLAKVYFLDGQHFLIRLPSLVRRAWPMDIGVILQRVVEDKIPSNMTKISPWPLPTLYSLLDPLEEIKPISIVNEIIHNGINLSIKGMTRPFSDINDIVVYVNDRGQDGSPILVTLNRITLRHSIYKYITIKEDSLKAKSEDIFDLKIKPDVNADIFLELVWTEPTAQITRFEETSVFIAHGLDGHEILCIFTSSTKNFVALDINVYSHGFKVYPKFVLNVDAAVPVLATRSRNYDILFVRGGSFSTLELWIGYDKHIPLNLNCEIIKTEYQLESYVGECKGLQIDKNDPKYSQVICSQRLPQQYLVANQFISDKFLGLRDWVHNRVNLVLKNNIIRISLNFIPNSKLVRTCLEALSFALPTALYFDFKAQYFLFQYGNKEEFRDILKGSEWENFIIILLSFFRLEGQGVIDEKSFKELDKSDWNFLSSTFKHSRFNFNNHLRCIQPSTIVENDIMINSFKNSQRLYEAFYAYYCQLENKCSTFLPSILISLHLVYQDLKLNYTSHQYINELIPLLMQLAKFIKWDTYVDYYKRNYGMNQLKLIEAVIMESALNPDHPFFSPPDINQWILKCIRKPTEAKESFPTPLVIGQIFSIPELNENLVHDFDCCQKTRQVCAIYHKLINEGEKSMILEIVNIGYTINDIDALPCGLALPLREAIRKCREDPPSDWPGEAYILVGREDLAELTFGMPIGYIHARGNRMEMKPKNIMQIVESTIPPISPQDQDEDINGTEISNHEITDLRFGNDKRLLEVQKLLQSCNTIKVDFPTVDLSSQSDENSPQILERVQIQCLKNFSHPAGRAVLTYSTVTPIATEPFPIPGLSLAIKVLPFNTLVQVERALRLPESAEWPEFHDGVASGLRIPSTIDIEGSWISLNKPKELTNSHAGFLLGLGLNGHLKSMATWQAVEYLMKTPKHDITTIALVLGLPASYIGTMNAEVMKFIAVHVTAMFPPKSTSLNVSPLIQTASILGCGLLYMETCDRYMSQVMLSEISTQALKMSDSSETDFTEGYSLAAGLALGFINLGQGDSTRASTDLDLLKELRLYISGDNSTTKKLSTSTHNTNVKTDNININITSPGATIALGLLYLKTNNVNVANKIPIPETEFFLDYVRPDFLLIRTLARNLIMWDNIQSTKEWVESHVPQYIKSKLISNPDINYENLESIKRSNYYILSGACFSMALKYAGSDDKKALKCLLSYLDLFIGLESTRTRASTFDENITMSAIKSCLNVLSTSVSIVAAGSGNLEVLRRIRKLHRQEVDTSNSSTISHSYGTHMVTSMSLGFLFLGGGNFTLSTSNKAIAGLVCALFPRYPIEPYDNRAHLQAFRHLWVLAVEPRCLVLRDIETREACHVPVKLVFKDYYNAVKVIRDDGRKEILVDSKSKVIVAPCLLPESNFIQTIEIDSPRYWPIRLEFGKNLEFDRKFWKDPTIYTKRKIGHLTYTEDPQGLRDLLTRIFPDGKSLVGTRNQATFRRQNLDFIRIFSSDPQVQAFTRYLCEDFNTNDDGQALSAFCTGILSECLNEDKVEAIQIYQKLYQIQQDMEGINEMDLWNVILVLEYYENIPKIIYSSEDNAEHQKSKNRLTEKMLIKKEFIASLRLIMERYFEISFDALISFFNNVNNTNISQMQKSFSKILYSYFTDTEFPSAEQLGGEENKKRLLQYLAAWLIYHEIPDKNILLNSMKYIRELKEKLNMEMIQGEITKDDVVLQILSTFWPNLSINTLKIIQYCLN